MERFKENGDISLLLGGFWFNNIETWRINC